MRAVPLRNLRPVLSRLLVPGTASVVITELFKQGATVDCPDNAPTVGPGEDVVKLINHDLYILMLQFKKHLENVEDSVARRTWLAKIQEIEETIEENRDRD